VEKIPLAPVEKILLVKGKPVGKIPLTLRGRDFSKPVGKIPLFYRIPPPESKSGPKT